MEQLLSPHGGRRIFRRGSLPGNYCPKSLAKKVGNHATISPGNLRAPLTRVLKSRLKAQRTGWNASKGGRNGTEEHAPFIRAARRAIKLCSRLRRIRRRKVTALFRA